jgi:hypothetical protein
VFVLSVGFHHFMCLVYDGAVGNRQFGAVNRFGRRAAEDLLALLGKSAFTFTALATEESQVRRRRSKPKEEAPPPEPSVEPLIERAQEWAAHAEEPPPPEPEPMRLEPIEDFDLSLFDKQALENIDTAAADDLFDPDRLAEIASETRRDHGPLSYDEARELGIIP